MSNTSGQTNSAADPLSQGERIKSLDARVKRLEELLFPTSKPTLPQAELDMIENFKKMPRTSDGSIVLPEDVSAARIKGHRVTRPMEVK